MSTIRRQSIISSVIVYAGFALGFLNTYLFTREGGFTPAQYGLLGTFNAIASLMYSFANLGMLAYIHKFFPYYNDNLQPKENDMITWALVVSTCGFIMVMSGGWFFQSLVIRKFAANSADVIRYYTWIFPFGFGLTTYSLLEAYAWQLKKSVLTNYLRELQFRLFTFLLIGLTTIGLLKDFDAFIKIYAFTYILLALILAANLVISKQFYFRMKPSRVTRKFFPKILTLAAFVWTGGLLFNIPNFFDVLVIAAVLPGGLSYVAVFTLAQYITSIMQAPQRAVISASLGPLSRAWKDKDLEKINRIYHRSSINQLIFACGVYVLICLNFRDGVLTFQMQPSYLQAFPVFIYLGLMRIVDMGTGLNSQIISTSTFWRFEFITGVILLSLSLPLNYILAKRMGVVGPAIATLISFALYNGIRYLFLLRKFGMQPFTIKTLLTLILAAGDYAICYWLYHDHQGFWWMVIRSVVFIGIYISGIITLDLTPDIWPVWATVKKKLGRH